MSPPSVLVMKQVWRKPSAVSKRVSWAPGGDAPPHQQPSVLRPSGKRDQVGQFGDPGPVADRTVGFSGLDPVLFLDEDQCVTNSLVDGESDGEVAVGRNDAVHESVGGPGRVGPHQDGVFDEGRMVAGEVAYLVLLGQSRQRSVEEGDVVIGVVAPEFPGRSMAARGSLVVSHHTPNGKNPKPFL